jgi:hypothetical protein
MIDLEMKFQVKFLLTSIKTNRDKHIETFNEAFKNYQIVLKQELKNLLDDVENKKDIDLRINLKKPISYEKDYDEMISMLENCTDEQITISSHDYKALVLDQWGWNDNFNRHTVLYSAGCVGIGTALPDEPLTISGEFRN